MSCLGTRTAPHDSDSVALKPEVLPGHRAPLDRLRLNVTVRLDSRLTLEKKHQENMSMNPHIRHFYIVNLGYKGICVFP